MLAAIEGPDILIVLAVVLLLFGGTQIPKLARSLGSASREFKRGQDEGQAGAASDSAAQPSSAAQPPSAAQPSTDARVTAGPTPEANGSSPTAAVR